MMAVSSLRSAEADAGGLAVVGETSRHPALRPRIDVIERRNVVSIKMRATARLRHHLHG